MSKPKLFGVSASRARDLGHGRDRDRLRARSAVARLEPAHAEMGRDIPPVLKARLGPGSVDGEQRLRQPKLVGQVGDEFPWRRLGVPEPEAWVAQQRHPGRCAQSVGVASPSSQKVEIVGPERVVARQGSAPGRGVEQRRPFFFG
jgi:hypothetical protein